MRRWNGSTGSITGDYCNPSETFRLPRPRKDTTQCSTTCQQPHNLNQMASGNPGAVQESVRYIILANAGGLLKDKAATIPISDVTGPMWLFLIGMIVGGLVVSLLRAQ